MKKRSILPVLFLLLTIAGAAFGQSTTFHFTGTTFEEGTSPEAMSVAVRHGFLPAAGDDPGAMQEKLPRGTGGLTLLCYVQSSGGKKGGKGGYLPLPGVPVEITGSRIKLMARTAESGYLLLALPAGDYEIRYASFKKKIRIDKGKTTLAAIRGGKRMVD